MKIIALALLILLALNTTAVAEVCHFGTQIVPCADKPEPVTEPSRNAFATKITSGCTAGLKRGYDSKGKR
jgi:hypothetical protein